MLSREVATLECVHHPNILRLFEVVETLGRVYLITEWIRGGELYNHITQGGPLREVHAAPLYKQLLLAVKHMHSLGFVHRDIKAENVLLVSENRLKLADFGFSTELLNGPQQKLDTFCGSPPYAAPELFSDDHYFGGPVDVWALGVLLYFMVVGNMPFRAPTVPALRITVLKGDYTVPGHLTLPCIRLIQRILVHLPARRPTIDDMISSQWVMYPNLSNELMTLEINHHTKNNIKNNHNHNNNNNNNNKKSKFMFRSTKQRQSRKNYSLRERYIEITNKLPLTFNTKKNDGIMIDNFLHPIDLTTSSNNDLNNQQLIIQQQQQQQQKQRRSFFSGTLKKKIGPMDNEQTTATTNNKLTKNNYKNGEIKFNDDTNNISTISNLSYNNTTTTITNNKYEQNLIIDIKTTTKLLLNKNYDEENGKFIMLPTDTDNLDNINPLEYEAREILEKLGVTSIMLRDAIKNGPRSDIIGAYRIIINRLQKQVWLAKRQNELNQQYNEQQQQYQQQQQQKKLIKRNRIGCTIL